MYPAKWNNKRDSPATRRKGASKHEAKKTRAATEWGWNRSDADYTKKRSLLAHPAIKIRMTLIKVNAKDEGRNGDLMRNRTLTHGILEEEREPGMNGTG